VTLGGVIYTVIFYKTLKNPSFFNKKMKKRWIPSFEGMTMGVFHGNDPSEARLHGAGIWRVGGKSSLSPF